MDDERRVGDPDRRSKDVREWVEEIEQGYKRRAAANRALIERLTHKTAIILAVLAIVQVGFGALSVTLLARTSHQQDAIKETIAAIQQQRIETIWDGCVSQNYRHDSTVNRLEKLVAAVKNPREKARAVAGVAGTISLINALAPRQDCRVVLRQRFALTDDRLTQVIAHLKRPAVPVAP